MSSCPDPELLDAFASGRASARDRAALLTHFDECADCASTAAELMRVYGPSQLGPSAVLVADHAIEATRPADMAFPGASSRPIAHGRRYRVLDKIGEGGMGAVFVAFDAQLNRKVAYKRLFHDEHASASEQRARLLLEAQAMAKLAHPNVVAVYDVGEEDGQLFVAMELVEGMTLAQWLAIGSAARSTKQAARSEREILGAFVQAGRGLAAAHGVGLVHRDFKPDNVLVGADGRARVTDFGLARPLRAPLEDPALLELDVEGPTRPLGRTAPGAIVGTPAYMAPEQLRGAVADARADQFAFGVSLYEALYGRRPFEGRTLRELMSNVLAGRVVPPPATAPRWQRQLFLRILALDPAARFPSMEAVLAELERDHGRGRRLAALGALAIVGAATIAGVTALSVGRTSRPTALARGLGPAPTIPTATSAAPARCAALVRGARDVWTSDRRSKFTVKHLLAEDVNASARLTARFDAFTDTWETTKRARCEGPEPALAAGVDPEAFSTCMSDRLRRFEALVTVVDPIDSYKIGTALDLGASLPDPAACASDDTLRWVPAPPSQASRGRAERMATDAARVLALTELGDAIDADTLSEQLERDVASLDHGPTRAFCLFAIGAHARLRRDWEASERLLTQAVEAARGANDVPDELAASALLGAVVGLDRFHPDDAERWLRAAAERAKDQPGLTELAASVALTQAEVQRQAGFPKLAEDAIALAVSLREARFGATHPLTARARQERALLAIDLEEPDGALIDSERALYSAVENFGELAPATAHAREIHGLALAAAGKLEDAKTQLTEALRVYKKFLAVGRAADARALDALGRVELALGHVDAAEELFQRSESGRKHGILIDHPDLAASLDGLAAVARARGKTKDAIGRLRDAVTAIEKAFAADDVRIVPYLLELATDLQASGDKTGAYDCLVRATKVVTAALGQDSPLFARIGLASGRFLLSVGNDQDALSDLDEASRVASIGYPSSHPLQAEISVLRARAALRLGDKARAKELYGVAVFDLEEHFGKGHPRVAEVERELAAMSAP
ncbi:MAG: serine/threonine-protein kinase [Polyangiaceae bacterium]